MNALGNARAARTLDRRLIALADCSLHLGATHVLDRVTVEVHEGELLAIVGPSGCGKSTLLRVLLGLIAPTGGGSLELTTGGRPLGMVFQKPTLLPWLTARRNVELSLTIGPRRVRERSQRQVRVERALALVGLTDFAAHYPHQLSGGMQQRLALARALVAEPAILLMDEPFGALDELTRELLNHELLKLREAPERPLGTVVLVTHSITEAVLLADRIVVMTARPARVETIIDVDLPRPRLAHFDRLAELPGFKAAVQEVRARIRGSDVREVAHEMA